MRLTAGTVIATGTPGGVAMGMKNPVYLKSGDVVKCVIGGMGELEKHSRKGGAKCSLMKWEKWTERH